MNLREKLLAAGVATVLAASIVYDAVAVFGDKKAAEGAGTFQVVGEMNHVSSANQSSSISLTLTQ